MNERTPNGSNLNLKIVSTEVKSTGEAVQLVRPLAATTKSTDEIVGELVNRFSYKTNEVKASDNELNAVQQAFGSNLAKELIKTYDGSNLVSDSQQDLIGERYLAEQIRLIQEQQKTTSILDKWSHLLYEGEKDYRPSSEQPVPPLNVENLRSRNGSASQYSLIQQQQPVASQIRLSQSGNLATSSSNQRLLTQVLSGVHSHSQSGLNSRTLSEIRIQEGHVHEPAMNEYRLQSQPLVQARSMEQIRAASEASRATEQTHDYQAQLQAQVQAQIQATLQAYVAEQQREAEEREAALREADQQHQQHQISEAEQLMQYEIVKPYDEKPFDTQTNLTQDSSNYMQSDRRSADLRASTALTEDSRKTADQPEDYLPRLSDSNLNSVDLDAYNTPQFKALLEQLSKPINIPPEQVNYPPEWPSQDKINLLAEPIYIPAPQPIVIPAPNIITLQNPNFEGFNKDDLPEDTVKPTVTYYPPIANDQNHLKNFGIRQINLNKNLTRTGSNLEIPSQNY